VVFFSFKGSMVESEDAEAHRELGMGFFFFFECVLCCAACKLLVFDFCLPVFFCLFEMLLLSLKIA
jgi:hypothetical protein